MWSKVFFLAAMMIVVTDFILIPVITESGAVFAIWMICGFVLAGLAVMLEATEK